MSGREPGLGLGLFAVLTGDENRCRPDIVRKYFVDHIGHCRIMTSSRSYSNEKTFVTLEFNHQSQVRNAIDRYNNCKINGCHVSLSHYQSRRVQPMGGGGGRFMQSGGRGMFNNRGGRFVNRGHFNNPRGNFGYRDGFRGRTFGPGFQRPRSYGEMEAAKVRGMSPSSAARYIEQRIDKKENRLPSAYSHGNYGSSRQRRSRSRSYSRSSSYDRSRSVSRSHSHSHSRSPSSSRQRSRSSSYQSRSASVDRDRRHSYSKSPADHSSSAHLDGHGSALSDEGSSYETHRRRRRRRKTRRRSPTSDSDSSAERRSHRRRKKRRRKKHRNHSDSDASQDAAVNSEPQLDVSVPEETIVLEGVDEWQAAEVGVIDEENVAKEEVVKEPESDELVVTPHLVLVMPAGLLPPATQQALRAKRDSLEQEYQADVSTIVSVAKMLASHDPMLKAQLQNALTLAVDDITRRYSAEFDSFVHQYVPSKS